MPLLPPLPHPITEAAHDLRQRLDGLTAQGLARLAQKAGGKIDLTDRAYADLPVSVVVDDNLTETSRKVRVTRIEGDGRGGWFRIFAGAGDTELDVTAHATLEDRIRLLGNVEPRIGGHDLYDDSLAFSSAGR